MIQHMSWPCEGLTVLALPVGGKKRVLSTVAERQQETHEAWRLRNTFNCSFGSNSPQGANPIQVCGHFLPSCASISEVKVPLKRLRFKAFLLWKMDEWLLSRLLAAMSVDNDPREVSSILRADLRSSTCQRNRNIWSLKCCNDWASQRHSY